MRARLIPALVVLALAACDDAAGPDAGDLSAAEVAALSDAMVDADFALTGDVAAADAATGLPVAAEPITATTEFTRTRTCPAGGQVVVEGSHVRVWDRDTHSGSSDLALTKTHQACARTVDAVTITLNGDPDVAVEAHHAWADGQRDGPQTLTMLGAVAWSADDGREGRCTIDVSAVFDPDTHTRTVTGTFCDRTFQRTTTWTGMGGNGGMGGTGGMGG